MASPNFFAYSYDRVMPFTVKKKIASRGINIQLNIFTWRQIEMCNITGPFFYLIYS